MDCFCLPIYSQEFLFTPKFPEDSVSSDGSEIVHFQNYQDLWNSITYKYNSSSRLHENPIRDIHVSSAGNYVGNVNEEGAIRRYNKNITKLGSTNEAFLRYVTLPYQVDNDDFGLDFMMYFYDHAFPLVQIPPNIVKEVLMKTKSISKSCDFHAIDSLINSYTVESRSVKMIPRKSGLKLHSFKDRMLLLQPPKKNIDILRNIRLDTEVALPERLNHLWEDTRKEEKKRSFEPTLSLDFLISQVEKGNIAFPIPSSTSSSSQTFSGASSQMNISQLSNSFTLTPITANANNPQTSNSIAFYPQTTNLRLSNNVGGTLNPRPLVRLMQQNQRQQFEHVRNMSQQPMSENATSFSSNLRLSFNHQGSNPISATSSQLSNPILNASALNLISSSGVIRANQLSLSLTTNTSSDNQSRPQQFFLQLQRQGAPQLQVSQQLRSSSLTVSSVSQSVAHTPLLSVQANLQGNRTIGPSSSMASSQLHFVQRTGNRQSMGTKRFIPSVSATGNLQNQFTSAALGNQQQSQALSAAQAPLVQLDFSKTVFRPTKRNFENPQNQSTPRTHLSNPPSTLSLNFSRNP